MEENIMKRKMISMCLACVAIVSLNVMPVRAQEWEKSFTVSSGFDKAWSKTHTFEYELDSGVSQYVVIDYGYDTFATNEDFVRNVHGVPHGYSGKGKVTNSKGTSSSTGWISSGFSSGKVDVKHTGAATYTGYLKD